MTSPIPPQDPASNGHPALPASTGSGAVPVQTVGPVYPGRYVDATVVAEQTQLGSYLRVLLRRRRWAIAVFALVVAFGVWNTYRATPIYEAFTTLRIDSPESQTPILSQVTTLQPGSPIETETQMLKSRSLAEQVVQAVGLNVGIVEPKGRRGDMIDSVAVVGEIQPGQYLVKHGSDGWVVSRNDRVVARGPDGQPLTFAGIRLTPLESTQPQRPLLLSVGPTEDAAAGLAGSLSVTVPVMYSNVVRVAYRSPDPGLAQVAVNTLAAEYIQQSRRVSKTEARSTREFIQSQLEQLSRELTRTEKELEAFKQESKIVALPTEADQGITTLVQFQVERERSAAERRALDVLAQGDSTGAGSPAVDLSTFPSFIENESIQQLKTELNGLESKKDLLLVENTPAHPDVVALQKQIDSVRGRMRDAARDYRSALSAKIKALDQTLAQSQSKLAQLPEKELRLAELMRAVKVNEELYTELQMKLKEAQIAEAAELASIRVIDPATRPQFPVAPNKRRNLITAMLLGVVLGCAAAFARDYTDSTLRTREHVESELRLPLLGTIPFVASNGRWALPSPPSFAKLRSRRSRRKRASREVTTRDTASLLTQLSTHSAAAEAFRAVRTNVLFLPVIGTRRARTLLVTSPGPGDGKTVVAANLAISFAQKGNRTVLLDADLRKGVQHLNFEVLKRPGLADYLSDHASLRDIVRRTPVKHLYLIPSGAVPPLPTELLESERLDKLIMAIVPQVDVMILDSPPVLPVADALVLSAKVDNVLLVVRSGFTHRTAANDALTLLSGVASGLLTGVLNGLKYEQFYGRGYYGQYYGGYYGGERRQAGAPPAAEEIGIDIDSV